MSTANGWVVSLTVTATATSSMPSADRVTVTDSLLASSSLTPVTVTVCG